MKQQTIITRFTRYSNQALELMAAHIVACMTDNPFFTTPNPTIIAVKAALEKFSHFLVASKNRNITDITERKKSREELMVLLTRLGEYVIFTSEGDIVKMAASGYRFTKLPVPATIPNPGNVTFANGVTSGQMKALIKAIMGAKAYAFDITTVMPTENTNWETINSSTSKYVFKNLLPGKQYWVRVGVIGSKGQIAYSPVATFFAQ